MMDAWILDERLRREAPDLERPALRIPVGDIAPGVHRGPAPELREEPANRGVIEIDIAGEDEDEDSHVIVIQM